MRKLTCLLLLLACMGSATAKEKVLGMGKEVYDAISEIQVMLDAEQWTEGLERLDKLRTRRMNGYETAHVLNMIGFTYYQLDRLPEALATYRGALAQEGLPESQVRALLMTVSQMALVSEDYPLAEQYANQLLTMEGDLELDPMAYVILAQALVGQERYADARVPMETAIQQQRDKGLKPRENWLALLSSVYYMEEDYVAMRDLLYYMVSLYPKEQYLMNLAALHGQLGDTGRQMALVEALLDDERLERDNHLVSLANLFMAHELPHKAASLLQREIEAGRIEASQRNLELESQAWYLAGEEQRAIPPLERAAELSGEGDLYLRVARLYMDIYDYNSAYVAAVEAAKNTEGEDLGEALLLQGMALARSEELDRAKEIFKRAAEYKESRKWATQWIRFVENEQARIAAFSDFQ